MIGLFMAVLYFVWKMFFDSDMSTEIGFLNASGFLFYWHLVWTIIFGIIIGLIALGVTGLMSLVGLGTGLAASEELAPQHSGKSMLFGLIGGAIFGGSLTAKAVLGFMVKRALLLLGAYLMWTSGTAEMSFAEFDLLKLGIGAVLLLIGTIWSKKKSSSNSNSDDE